MKGLSGNRAFVLVAFLSFFAYALTAQSGVEQQINDIKLDENYLYGEASDADHRVAYDLAVTDLIMTVNSVRADNGLQGIQPGDVLPLVKELSYKRGDKHEVMVYVELSEALSASHKEKNVPGVGGGTPTAPPARKPDPVPSVPSSSSNTTVGNIGDEVFVNLLEREMADNILGYLENAKRSGKIADFGIVRSLEEIKSLADCYMVLYRRDKSVAALLSPKQNGSRTNIRNKTADSLQNYRGHGIIWFR